MKYVAIETKHEGLYLEIELGFLCNYRCSYCPPYLHTGSLWIDHEMLMKFIKMANPTPTVVVRKGRHHPPGIDCM